MVIAGGAGGGAGPSQLNYTANIHGQAGTSGADGEAASAGGGTGGTNGNAGTSQWHTYGAGFYGQSSNSDTALSFTNSTTPGRGGMSVGGEGIEEEGGFGGGGKESGNCGGGGGGYSGGGGSGNADPHSGGGGGSYNNGSNKSALTGATDGWEGQGKVEITFIS